MVWRIQGCGSGNIYSGSGPDPTINLGQESNGQILLWRLSCKDIIYFISYVFYCGARKAYNLGIGRGENSRVVWIKNKPVLLNELIVVL